MVEVLVSCTILWFPMFGAMKSETVLARSVELCRKEANWKGGYVTTYTLTPEMLVRECGPGGADCRILKSD